MSDSDPVYTACRRLLEMVRVLHRHGYERLRIYPGMSPSGCHWRCEFVPAEMTIPGHCHKDNAFRMETARYSSGEGNAYFGWADAISDSPEKLAAKFIERFGDLSKASKGKDPAYASWYSRMLDETAPDGIILAYADYPLPKGHLPVQNRLGVKIPLPPSASPMHAALERAGYFKSLLHLSQVTTDQLLDTLRRQHLRVEPIPSAFLSGSGHGPRIPAELARLPIYLARGVRSWSGLVICFPGGKEELSTGFVGTPYLRRILHPILELFRRLGPSHALSGDE